jgi:elongation factor P--(R)-beta-lysine ligase
MHLNGYLEIEVPVLVKSPALEEHLHPVRAGNGYLHTSPEFAMKRVLAMGLPRIFSITPCFRDEEVGCHHGQEFTMLEWYRAGAGYREVMEECLGLLQDVAATVGVDIGETQTLTWAQAYVRYTGSEAPADEIEAMRVWVNDIEPKLQAPTFIIDYPANQAAFATVRGDIAERFELYWRGVELANAFTELLDPVELRERWSASGVARAEAGREPHPIDERVISAVSRHPRAGGIALGVDRLVMLLSGARSIHEVRLPG